MCPDLIDQLLAAFSDAKRLYRLQGARSLTQLLVEACRQEEQLDAPWRLSIDALSTDATLDVHAMLGQPITLHTRLADGSEHSRGQLGLQNQTRPSSPRMAAPTPPASNTPAPTTTTAPTPTPTRPRSSAQQHHP
jgi:hypothetical protein